MSPLSSVDDAPIAAIPGDTLRAGVLDQFRAELGDALVDSHLKPGDDLWLRIRTDAWRDAGIAARDPRIRLLLLPVGHRLDAVAVRSG